MIYSSDAANINIKNPNAAIMRAIPSDLILHVQKPIRLITIDIKSHNNVIPIPISKIDINTLSPFRFFTLFHPL